MTNDGDQGNDRMERNREAALDRLTEAFAADRIHMEEYESRVAVAQNARDDSELARALSGLPALGGAPSGFSERRDSAEAPGNRIDARLSGGSNIACVMGERRLEGDWLSGDRVSSATIMGSTSLDLRDSALPPGRLKLEVFVFMGELRVVVPRGLCVRLNVFPFMGDACMDRDVGSRVEPGKPYLEIDGFVMMGSIRIVSGA